MPTLDYDPRRGESAVIEVREGRRSPYRVRRLEGKLSASFRVKAAAELQDALWRRWGDQVPVLVDREPKIPPRSKRGC